MAYPTVFVDGHDHLGRLAYVNRLTQAVHHRLQLRGRDVAVAVFVKQSKRLLQRYTASCHSNINTTFSLDLQPVRPARQSEFTPFITSSPGRPVKYCDRRVCVPVYLSVHSHISKPHVQIFCTCYLWPWLSPPLTAMQYVMYFRFCGRCGTCKERVRL